MSTHLSCIFPDKAEALLVARYISGNPDVEELPPDGWITDEATGARYYYNIAAFGVLTEPTGETDPETGQPLRAPIMWDNGDGTEQEAYCLIGLWSGPEDTVPFPLQAFMVQDLGVHYG